MNQVSEPVDIRGAVFNTIRCGQGAPIVWLHGGPGLWDYLSPLAAMTADVAAAYRYDQRACGRSSGEGPHTIARNVADLEGLRAHWGLDRFVVAGHSWGASLALHYALAYPPRTRGLIYLSGTGVDPAWNADYRAARAARLGEAGERERVLADERWDRERTVDAEHAACVAGWRADYADVEAGRGHARAMLAAGLRVNRTVNADLNADAKQVTLHPAMPDRLRGLDVPMLVVHGEEDPRPAWAARQVAELIPGGQFVLLSGAGHSPWIEAPDALKAALRAFFASLAA